LREKAGMRHIMCDFILLSPHPSCKEREQDYISTLCI